jgi:hypothetical protein
MIQIGDLLSRDLSRPIGHGVDIHNDDPNTVFTEIFEYVVTDDIQAEYTSLFSGIAQVPRSQNGVVGIWISGAPGSGKSAFAKTLGYLLTNREVRGVRASSLMRKKLTSLPAIEALESLNRTIPYEMFRCDFRMADSAQTAPRQIAELLYRTVLHDLDYAADYAISELELALEEAGKLADFQTFCRAEYKEDWRETVKSRSRLERLNAALQRFDPESYKTPEAWLNSAGNLSSTRTDEDLVRRCFDFCEQRRRGKAVAFILDDLDSWMAPGDRHVEGLLAVIAQLEQETLARLKAGTVPGSTCVIVTTRKKLARREHASYEIEISSAVIREVVVRRVLGKPQNREDFLRKMFQNWDPSRTRNIELERSNYRTDFDQDEFVRCYPYFPHFIDLSVDILAGIAARPDGPTNLPHGNCGVIRQAFEMLIADPTPLAKQPIGSVVSLDAIYEVIKAGVPAEKRQAVVDICERFDHDADYPGMAGRVAKAICLMDLAGPGLPCTPKNIAAVLVQRIHHPPPVVPVAAILYRLKQGWCVRETKDGWKLSDLEELRRTPAGLSELNRSLGRPDSLPPARHNILTRRVMKLLGRVLAPYTRSLQKFNGTVMHTFEAIIWEMEHLSAKIAASDSAHRFSEEQLSTSINGLEARLAALEKNVRQLGVEKGAHAGRPETSRERTAYVIGLFGTGRRYVNELIARNVGEREKYFRDFIRLHPGPTPMIYSGHATMKYSSRGQESPAVMHGIVKAVREGFADSIFFYRHPLDSLLTNWVFWRRLVRHNEWISGICQVYQDVDALCADLDEHFLDFRAFAHGAPEFFAGNEPRFLSFAEFVEETELHRQAATLSLRLEDFMLDPGRELSKIMGVMSIDTGSRQLRAFPPVTTSYRHVAVGENVPRFRKFVDSLNSETKGRMEAMGYPAG